VIEFIISFTNDENHRLAYSNSSRRQVKDPDAALFLVLTCK